MPHRPTKHVRPLLALLVGAAMALMAPAGAGAQSDDLADRTVDLVQEYLRIDTINPPGNESRGVDFFARILEAEGIPYETAESAPGRGNLWATLEATVQPERPGLVLLHHIDVVTADPEYWSVDPLSGEIRDGFIWGRGALDTKTLGVLHLQAFLELHRSGAPRDRDVIFMATADEEAGGFYGAGWLIENRPELFENVNTVLNEGGSMTVEEGVATAEVEVTQKVPVWLKLTATGEPGHGSTPRAESAVTRIVEALSAIRANPFEPRIVPAVDEYFRAIAPSVQEPWRSAFTEMSAAIQEPGFLDRLQAANPFWHAITRNTCSLTMLEGSSKINVVPPVATAQIDCRVLPDQDVDAFEAALESIIDDENVTIERIMAFSPAVSNADTDDFRTLRNVLAQYYDRVDMIPGVSSGFTDSHFFRDLDILAYGFAPIAAGHDEWDRIHGNDERVPVEAVRTGVRVMSDVVREMATPEQ